MKKSKKVYLVLVYISAVIIGLVLAVGFLGTVGLWPEGWKF